MHHPHRLLTHEECDLFLTQHLKFPNWEEILRTDKLKFLSIFTEQHTKEIGYQNVTMGLRDLEIRDCPSIEEMIKTGLSGMGGMCIELNYFAKILLVSIGFDAFLIAGTANSVAVPNNHSILVVRLSPNELYLCDVGMAQPTNQPVPLHALPFRGQMLGYPYEYRWLEDQKEFARVHIKGKVAAGEFKDKTEDNFMSFTLEPRDFDYFYESMAIIYKDCYRFNLRGLFLSRYFDIPEAVDEQKEDFVRYVMVFGKAIYSGNSVTRKVVKYTSYLDMIPALRIYFPKLSEENMKLAFKNFTI